MFSGYFAIQINWISKQNYLGLYVGILKWLGILQL